MTRNTPRTAHRVLMVLAPAMLVTAVTIGLVGAAHAPGAAAGERSGSPTGTAHSPGTAGGPDAAASGATPGEGAGSPAGTAVPAAVKTNPDCLTDDLTGTVFGQPRHPNSTVRDAVLRLTNTSGRTCQIQGWADIAMVTPPGELVRVPTQKVGRAGTKIILTPQASAWTRIQWDTCEAGRKGCEVGVALQYIADPDSTGAVADMVSVPEADQAGITMRAMRVSPLQRTRAAALNP